MHRTTSKPSASSKASTGPHTTSTLGRPSHRAAAARARGRVPSRATTSAPVSATWRARAPVPAPDVEDPGAGAEVEGAEEVRPLAGEVVAGGPVGDVTGELVGGRAAVVGLLQDLEDRVLRPVGVVDLATDQPHAAAGVHPLGHRRSPYRRTRAGTDLAGGATFVSPVRQRPRTARDLAAGATVGSLIRSRASNWARSTERTGSGRLAALPRQRGRRRGRSGAGRLPASKRKRTRTRPPPRQVVAPTLADVVMSKSSHSGESTVAFASV